MIYYFMELNRRMRFLSILLFLCGSAASSFGLNSKLDGYTQFWFKYEQVENGKIHLDTREEAAMSAAGFSINRLRVGVKFADSASRFSYVFGMALEDQVQPLDAYGMWEAYPWLIIKAGQMKIPASSERMQSSAKMFFVKRSAISLNLAEWALIKTPYIGLFEKAASSARDAGLNVTGRAAGEMLQYNVMIGNGFGLNRFMGGNERHFGKSFYANSPGQFLYAGRLQVNPYKKSFIGTAGSYNYHDNIILSDKNTVRHFERWTWCADGNFDLPYGMAVQFLYGRGEVMDNYPANTLDQAKALIFSGYSLGFTGGRYWKNIETGIRFDRYIHEYDEDGYEKINDQIIAGINYYIGDFTRLQLNYIIKYPIDDVQQSRETDDDLMVMNIEVVF